MAAAVITVEESCIAGVCKVKWTWTCSDTGAGSKATSSSYFGQVLALVTDPGNGGAAPTDNYDITITDADSYDVLQGAGADRDTANTETAVPAAVSVGFGVLTLTLANAGNAKSGTATLYIKGAKVG